MLDEKGSLPELMKRCHACNGKVPESVKAPCPLCGESKGFEITREVIEQVKVSESAEWVLEGKRDVKIPTVDRPKRRKMLIIIAISVAVSVFFPLEDKVYTPLVILIAFFIGSIPLFIDDYIIHRKRVRIHSKKGMEILED